MRYCIVKCYTWDKNLFNSMAFALFLISLIFWRSKFIWRELLSWSMSLIPMWVIAASKFCSSKVRLLWCNKSFDEAPGKCLNLARPDLKVLLNSDLVPLLKLTMLSPRIVILLVWGVLVFPVTASRYVFSPEIVHFFWKLYWFSRNLFKTTSGLFDYSCLEYVFYGITTNYRSIVIIRLIVLVICCSFTIYKL